MVTLGSRRYLYPGNSVDFDPKNFTESGFLYKLFIVKKTFSYVKSKVLARPNSAKKILKVKHRFLLTQNQLLFIHIKIVKMSHNVNASHTPIQG